MLEDLAVIHDVKYGLFNVDEWKIVLVEVVAKKVENFEINNGNREELQQKVIYNVCDISDDFRNSERYFLINSYEI